MMSKAMDGVSDELDFVRRFYDVTKMLTSDSTSKLTNQTVKDMPAVLQSDSFAPGQEMFLTMGNVVEESATELETCDCHRAIWEMKVGRKRRVAEMLSQTGRKNCCWMGRRLPYFIVKGKAKLLNRCRTATSAKLQHMICSLTDARRVDIIQHLDQLRTDLVEQLVDKLDCVDHAPLVIAGAFYSVYDGNWARAKEYVRRCFKETEDAVAQGKVDKLHRTAKKFLPGTAAYDDGQRFLAADNEPMWKFPRLFQAVLVFALLPVVERRIEGIHARIKALGHGVYGAGLPYMCAAVREPKHLEQLRTDPDFLRFSIKHWHDRSG